MCECDGLCKLDREELLAVLKVRLQRLPPKQIVNLIAVVNEWRATEKEELSAQHSRLHSKLVQGRRTRDEPCAQPSSASDGVGETKA